MVKQIYLNCTFIKSPDTHSAIDITFKQNLLFLNNSSYLNINNKCMYLNTDNTYLHIQCKLIQNY